MNEEIINLITYFIIYSFIGWVLESVLKTIVSKKPVNSGFLNGPICPIYGIGAIIMYVFLDDVSQKPLIAFCLGFVVLSIWEYAVGTLLEKLFETKYWDYSNHKFNLQGRVCLTNSICWGVLGVLFIDVLHPFMQDVLSGFNQEWILYADITIMVIMLIDLIVSVNVILGMKEKLMRIEELNNSIKEKLNDAKQKGKDIEIKNESVQLIIDDLNKKRNKIVRKSYKTAMRLKMAFPTMKSEQITNFINQKMDYFKKDKN